MVRNGSRQFTRNQAAKFLGRRASGGHLTHSQQRVLLKLGSWGAEGFRVDQGPVRRLEGVPSFFSLSILVGKPSPPKQKGKRALLGDLEGVAFCQVSAEGVRFLLIGLVQPIPAELPRKES